MEDELNSIFLQTFDAHFNSQYGLSKNEYRDRFKGHLKNEVGDAPELDTEKGTLATYIKLSVLVLAMIRLFEEMGVSESEIGKIIYQTADAYFHLSPAKRAMQKWLFFTKFNRKQIQKRQDLSSAAENGINGFKLALKESESANTFGVDYLQCGICTYYKRKNKFEYVKYCCLVDYAIMENMGVSFSRTTTIGNGGEKCDFNFSKKGEIATGWPPYNLPEFQNAQLQENAG